MQIFEVDLGCTLDRFSFVDLSTLRFSLIDRIGAQTAVSTRSLRTSSRVATAGASNARAAASSAASPADLSTALASVSGSAFKQLVVLNKAALWLFLCELIPDWAFCWQELGTAAIQSDGTFSAEVCFWCPDDLPDLYFEVVQNIDGTEVEISDPQIVCSTYYNYDGSQSVDIVVDDPRAIACLPTGPEGPGYLYVWPTAIGNKDLGNIDGLDTGSGTGLLPGNTPFGGTLSLQMVFHRHLIANDIRYYRWSYKFDSDAAFTPITAPVTHRYITEEDLLGGTIVIHKNSVNLGPQVVGPRRTCSRFPTRTFRGSTSMIPPTGRLPTSTARVP